MNIDEKNIVILLRDVNGARVCVELDSVQAFHSFDWSWYDDENYEILVVEWGNHCIYTALINEAICLEDLTGFFG